MKKEENKFGIDIISPESFYSNENEKIRLNWFCYELSLGIYDEIKENLDKLLREHFIDEKEIADFSIFISMEIKKIILKKNTSKIKISRTTLNKMIKSYFPDISDKISTKIIMFDEGPY